MLKYELLFLGLLKEKPKYGYEIKKQIKEILAVFTGVELKSIYYPLRRLEKEGLVIKRTERKGNRPLRFVYSLTELGERRFMELLNRSLLTLQRPQFSLDLSLYFLHYLKPKEAQRKLKARIIILRRLIRGIKKMLGSLKKKDNFRLVSILEHNQKMAETELNFLKKFLGEFYSD